MAGTQEEADNQRYQPSRQQIQRNRQAQLAQLRTSKEKAYKNKEIDWWIGAPLLIFALPLFFIYWAVLKGIDVYQRYKLGKEDKINSAEADRLEAEWAQQDSEKRYDSEEAEKKKGSYSDSRLRGRSRGESLDEEFPPHGKSYVALEEEIDESTVEEEANKTSSDDENLSEGFTHG